ncbi:MAG: hypothetical protein QOE58_555 [Actinomycetota bacterium]|nr:hypothetical protein [Actinomycetota bacterium]
MAYPTHVAAALSGASLRQLQYWRQRHKGEPLLAPEARSGGRVLYSFRDLMALRTFVYLREQLPLQRIRKAVSNLGQLGDGEHLSAYRLYVSGSSIVWAESDDRLVDLVEMPGQYKLAAEMRDVVKPFTNLQGAEVVDLLRPRQRLEVDPGVRGGYPVVLDTRIPYDIIAGLVADGVPPAEVAYFYPPVDAGAAGDAFDFHRYVESLRGRDVSVSVA